MSASEATTTMTVRMPEKLKEKLESLARSTARSKSWLAVDALRAYLELQEWQIKEIESGIQEADAGDFASPEEVNKVLNKWSDEDAH